VENEEVGILDFRGGGEEVCAHDCDGMADDEHEKEFGKAESLD
jgi:hypothetical protein